MYFTERGNREAGKNIKVLYVEGSKGIGERKGRVGGVGCPWEVTWNYPLLGVAI